MTEKQMKDFIKERINLIENNGIKENFSNQNGLLIHIIPGNLIDKNLIKWSEEKHQDIIKRAFKKIIEIETIYEDLDTGILGYTPDKKYFMCFQNGIVETYKHPLKSKNTLDRDFDFIKIDNIFYPISNTLESSKIVYQEILQSTPPYYIFITLLGVKGTYFCSYDESYKSIKPFQANNATFEPFTWDAFDDNIMSEIKSEVHCGINKITETQKIR